MSRLFRLPASNPWHLLQLICQCNSDFAHHCGFKWQFISVSNIPVFIYNPANFVSLVAHFWCYHQDKCASCQYKHSFICVYGLYLSKNENSCDLQPLLFSFLVPEPLPSVTSLFARYLMSSCHHRWPEEWIHSWLCCLYEGALIKATFRVVVNCSASDSKHWQILLV